MTHNLLALFRRLLSDVNCVHLLGYRNGSFRQLPRDCQQVDDSLSRAIHDFPKMVLMVRFCSPSPKRNKLSLSRGTQHHGCYGKLFRHFQTTAGELYVRPTKLCTM